MRPMLAKTGDENLINKEGYIYEPKLDGIRVLFYFEKKIRFISRNGMDLTRRFQNIKPVINAFSCIIDGEMVAYDNKGNPDFHKLQNGEEAVYVAFDIIQKDGKDLKDVTLIKRKAILRDTVVESKNVQLMFYTDKGEELLESIKKRGVEGVVAKKKNSTYHEGRSDAWQKIKLTKTVDCVIIGFSSMKRKISSFALGLYDKGELVYIGNVGTGFDNRFIDEFLPKLDKIRTKKNFAQMPKNIIHVKPVYVAEVGYLEFTPDMKLRAPVFKRLRDDKPIEECNFENVQ